jgi:hypothetical protein
LDRAQAARADAVAPAAMGAFFGPALARPAILKQS